MADETCLINRLYAFINSKPAPWNTLELLLQAEQEFPEQTSGRLRIIISSILIGLRRGANDLMTLSMAAGPKKDDHGTLLIDISRDCINRYNSST